MPKKRLPVILQDSVAEMLLAVIAMSGEFPARLFGRLPGKLLYIRKVVTRLKQQNLITVYCRNNLRGYRLLEDGKRTLLTRFPGRYESMFTGDTMVNAPKYSITHRTRCHRMAEVLTMMLNAGIKVFPWEKPLVFQQNAGLSDSAWKEACYYSAPEVKSIGLQGSRIRGSRATGLLLTGHMVCAIYNIGPMEMIWDYRAELRLKAFMQVDVCQSRLSMRYQDSQLQALIIAPNMDQLPKLISDMTAAVRHVHAGAGSAGDKAEKGKRFTIGNDYEHFYYLTDDDRGDAVLRLLCNPYRKQMLDDVLMIDLIPGRQNWKMENDAFTKTGAPVLFGYTCDMPRIKRFIHGLRQYQLQGRVICFDYQEEAIKAVFGTLITTESIDFDAAEKMLNEAD